MPSIHILSNPHSPVHIDNRTDPFSIAVVRFIDNMQLLGWDCIHYGLQGSQVNCKVEICLDKNYKNPETNRQIYNTLAGNLIEKNKKPGDIIVCFYGWENKDATLKNNDLIIVEPSIGYDTKAVFAPYRIFVSYAQMHMFYGQNDMLLAPSWTDTVIPNSFDPSEFTFSDKKEDYLLFLGRVVPGKGVDVAIRVTSYTGHKLIIAGPGSIKDVGFDTIPSNVEIFGIANVEQRRKLLSNAKAVIAPTRYVEPFGNMVIEGFFSGTPAITTDWGGFSETVINGKTGFRFRDDEELLFAINSIDTIKPIDCYNFALENYEEKKVHIKFDKYLKKILSAR